MKPLSIVIKELWERHEDGREVFAHAILTQPVTMRRWNGKHPVDDNTTTNVAPAGARVFVAMFSRFGDVGIRDRDIDQERHGYSARVMPETLTDWQFLNDGGVGWRKAQKG